MCGSVISALVLFYLRSMIAVMVLLFLSNADYVPYMIHYKVGKGKKYYWLNPIFNFSFQRT